MSSIATFTTAPFGDVVGRHVERVPDDELDNFERWVGVDHLDGESLRLRRTADNSEGTRPPTFRYAFGRGDVLLPTRRPALMKAAMAGVDGLTGEKVLVLKVRDKTRLHPRFLPHLVFSKTVRDWIVRRAVGSVTPHFRWSDLASLPLRLPALDQQQRLADALDKLHEVLESTRDLCVATRNLQSRVFEGLVKDAPSRRVADICLEPPRNGKSPRCNSDQRGYPTLSVGCLYSGIVDTKTELKFAELDEPTYQRFRLVPGDVLVVRGNGNRELCGRAGVVVENDSGCFFPDLLIRLRFDPAVVLPQYASIAWNALPVHRVLLGRAKSTNGIYKINGKDVRAHEIPVPPLTVQHEVVRQFEQIRDAGDAAETRTREALHLIFVFMGEHFDSNQGQVAP